ncbi:YbbR-like domain-containing protein [Selenomonas ruminantium]|uniref:CdaR family protein n=1 Tax=Selenomonas ruminantium TaxID=971 RepID=UPI0026EB075D|nr:CdaR family protein [Selenomonas ruminantium]
MISSFRSLVQHNLAAKIASILVAVILWGYVMNDQNPSTEGSFTAQVQLVNVPEGYKVTQEEEKAKIAVRGARSLFVNSSDADFHAYVDLRGAEAGTNHYKIRVEMPQGFELVDVYPESMEVTLDPIVQRRVRADINVNGSPASGVTVASVTQKSDEVLIEGPSTLVNEVDRLIGYVGLTSKNETDFSLQVPLTAINADGREVSGVTIQPAAMYVTVQMARGLTKKIVTVTPIPGEDLDSRLELVAIKPEPMQIEIAGAEEVIANLKSVNTEKISLADVFKNTNKAVKLDIPPGVTVTNHDVLAHIVVKSRKTSKDME